MSDPSSNDNSPVPKPPDGFPDAHGQAAMLLVETLVHVLIEKSMLTVAEAVEMVDSAADVSRVIAEELGDQPAPALQSVTLLTAISRSLSRDSPQS